MGTWEMEWVVWGRSWSSLRVLDTLDWTLGEGGRARGMRSCERDHAGARMAKKDANEGTYQSLPSKPSKRVAT